MGKRFLKGLVLVFIASTIAGVIGDTTPKPATGVALAKDGNGQVIASVPYTNNKIDGDVVFYFDDAIGTRHKEEYHYKNGKLDGLATVYNSDGTKAGEYTFSDGNVTSWAAYDEIGGKTVYIYDGSKDMNPTEMDFYDDKGNLLSVHYSAKGNEPGKVEIKAEQSVRDDYDQRKKNFTTTHSVNTIKSLMKSISGYEFGWGLDSNY